MHVEECGHENGNQKFAEKMLAAGGLLLGTTIIVVVLILITMIPLPGLVARVKIWVSGRQQLCPQAQQ
jgi:hypothetical protein